MRTHILFLAACVFGFAASTSNAQSFQSYAECDSKARALAAEAQTADHQWADCAANIDHGQTFNCGNMRPETRHAQVLSLASKRDGLYSQARQVSQICDGMRSAERDQARQRMLADQAAEREKRDSDKRRTLSAEQFNRDRAAEAQYQNQRNGRDDLARRQAEQAQESARREEQANRRAAQANQQAANAQLGAALTTLWKAPELDEDPYDWSNSVVAKPSANDQYNQIQDDVQKLHRPVQKTQPIVVTEIQNKAWEDVRRNSNATLSQSDLLIRMISEQESPGRGPNSIWDVSKNPWNK